MVATSQHQVAQRPGGLHLQLPHHPASPHTRLLSQPSLLPHQQQQQQESWEHAHDIHYKLQFYQIIKDVPSFKCHIRYLLSIIKATIQVQKI